MELINGGEMFEIIKDSGSYSGKLFCVNLEKRPQLNYYLHKFYKQYNICIKMECVIEI